MFASGGCKAPSGNDGVPDGSMQARKVRHLQCNNVTGSRPSPTQSSNNIYSSRLLSPGNICSSVIIVLIGANRSTRRDAARESGNSGFAAMQTGSIRRYGYSPVRAMKHQLEFQQMLRHLETLRPFLSDRLYHIAAVFNVANHILERASRLCLAAGRGLRWYSCSKCANIRGSYGSDS